MEPPGNDGQNLFLSVRVVDRFYFYKKQEFLRLWAMVDFQLVVSGWSVMILKL